MICLDELDPDWELAMVHAKTTIAGKVDGSIENAKRCPCCFRKIITQPISFFSNSKQLEVLGFGYPLYFKFLKYTLILILFQVCCYNILSLYNAIVSNQQFCSLPGQHSLDSVCHNSLVGLTTVSQQISAGDTIIRVCSFAIQLFLLIYIRHKMKTTLQYYKQRKSLISDYAVLIKDLPKVQGLQQKLKKMFKQFFRLTYQTEQIILIGFLQQYYELQEQKKKLLHKKIEILDQQLPNQEELELINVKIAKIQHQLESETEKTISMTKKDQLICEKVIVIFQTEQIKETIIKEFPRLMKKREKIKQIKKILDSEDVESIRIIEAPEPEQIIWKHINVPRKKRRIKQVIGWLLTLLFMAAITTVLYFVIREKSLIVEEEIHQIQIQIQSGQHHNLNDYQTKIGLLVYFFIFAVLFLNKFVISKFLHIISDFQKHPTYSKEEYYFAIKYTLTLFLTTAIITLLVEDVTLHNINQSDYGVVHQESIMFIVNSFFIPLIWLINPFQITRVIFRKINFGKQEYTQKQANQLMMDYPASLGKLFSETIETIWFTYMYSTVIPLGGILVLVGFAINYWIVKFNILKRSSIDHQVSGKFIMMALTLLDFSIIMKPAGQLIFDSQIRDNINASSIVCLIIGVIYLLLPMNLILATIHKQEFLLHEKSYNEVKHMFVTNYQMFHPIYSLKKIFVEKEAERLSFYVPSRKQERRPTKKISVNIEMALLRRSSQCREESKLSRLKQETNYPQIIMQTSERQEQLSKDLQQNILQ